MQLAHAATEEEKEERGERGGGVRGKETAAFFFSFATSDFDCKYGVRSSPYREKAGRKETGTWYLSWSHSR